ncbi:MAG: acyl-CoA dehydrogenase family protein, partial [Myxococcales bacterium]|nr:acyl-CoA dehydrogenase family protein [Myxococcales bacterium]
MDFSLSPRVHEITATLRAFMDREVLPLESKLLSEGFVAVLPELRGVRERARATGLFAAHIPEEHGGAGLSLVEFAHMSEALGRSPLGHYAFNCQAPDVGNMEVLLLCGTPAQRERYFRPLFAGEIRSCFTMTEPEFAGSNPVWLGTSATLDGDAWVIDGHKWFSTGAEGSAFAICMAVTDPEAKEPHARASMILVPTDTPGFELVRNLNVMGDRGGDWASHAEVRYRSVRVPAENL